MSISSIGPIGMPKATRGLIDLVARLAVLDPLHGAQHVGHQHAVDEEARAALHHHRALADGEREGGALRDIVVAC